VVRAESLIIIQVDLGP